MPDENPYDKLADACAEIVALPDGSWRESKAKLVEALDSASSRVEFNEILSWFEGDDQ